MEITIAELHEHVTRRLAETGAPAEEIDATAEICIDAELREHRSHGIRLLRNIATEYALGEGRRRPMRVEDAAPSIATVDGGYHLSPFVHREAVDLLARKTAEAGVAVVGVRNAGVSGALGYLVERVARQGFVAIALNSTPLVVVAPGSATPALGTNPLAIGVPRQSRTPLVLDMATSSIAFNEVMRLRALGGELPEGVALDETGEPTTDPQSAVGSDGRGRVLPFGGHRGYGLALMIELIVSGFVTGRSGAAKRGEILHEPDDFGALYLAFDPGLLGDINAGDAAIEGLLADISATGGRLPGEQSSRLRDAHIATDRVTLDDTAQAALGLR